NFGRLPTPALREVIEKLERVQFRKGNLIIKEGDSAGPMYILEKGRARAFTQNNGAQVNLALYRDRDFFGELSILNGSPRASSIGKSPSNNRRDRRRRLPTTTDSSEKRRAASDNASTSRRSMK